MIVRRILHERGAVKLNGGDNRGFCNKREGKHQFFVLPFIIILMVFQQVSSQEKLLPVFHFNQLTTADGLPTNEIRSNIVRDRQGFIWIGTVNGLVRYDGYACKVYLNDPKDPASLSSTSVISLCYDKQGRLWIGTWDTGLSLYDPVQDRFINFLPREGDSTWLQAKTIAVIHEDRSGNIWLGTMCDGIVRINFDTSKEESSIDSIAKHIRFHTIFPGGKRNDICDIDEYEDSKIIAASLGGLFCIDSLNRIEAIPNLPRPFKSLLDTAITTCLFWETPEKLWIGTPFQGLFVFDRKRDIILNFHKREKQPGKPRDNPIHDIQLDGGGHMWIMTEAGLDLFDVSKGEYLEYLSVFGAPPPTMMRMLLSLDNTGTLWIASGQDGVYFLTNKSFRLPHYGLRDAERRPKEMETINKWSDGTYWIGTEGKVIQLHLATLNVVKTVDLFKGEKNKYDRLGVEDSYDDENGRLWYGTWGLGIYKFEPASGRTTNLRYTKQLPDLIYKADICRSMTGAGRSGLFIAAYNDGLMKLDTRENRFSRVTGTSASHVMKDNEGRIWIANERDGLFIFNPATGQTEQLVHEPNNPKSLSYNRTIQTYQDPHGRIWAGSRDVIELWEPATKAFKHYPNEGIKDGFYALPLGGDASGRLWVSYFGGALGILDPTTSVFTDFGYSSGVCGYLMHMELLDDGRIMLVGSGGMNIVRPESLFAPLTPPPLVVTRMTVDDALQYSPLALSAASALQFEHNQNVIEFEFAAIKPGEGSLIEYRYKLDGLEKEWINPKDKRYVRYPGLSPGAYVFRVKAISTRHEWQPQEISLAIFIAPPWWQTWWAYTLYGFAFLGMLYGGYRTRLRQVQLKQQVEMEHFQTEHLAEVDKLKSRFFSNISHEFRTPLTLILGPAEQMLDQSKDGEVRQKSYLIKDNAKKLLGLVNQLLDFSRLESGVEKLQVSGGDIAQFLRRIVMSFESWAEKKSIVLTFQTDLDAMEGWFDANKLEKIVNNLMSNALKFTPEGGKIDVTLAVSGNDHGTPLPLAEEGLWVRLRVTDTGPGIAPEHLPHIFDRFYRVDDTHTTEGTGIGLALVKELVQLHHGTIHADSAAGHGSTFTVVLPIGRSAYASSEITKTPPQCGEHERIELVEPSAEVAATPAGKNSEGKPIVLVVEDNADLREFIREFLEKDYAVREAGDGEAGYNTALEIVPDLIISDIMMSKMDGIKLCRTVKQDVRTSHVPVILLTARAGADSKVEGLETGADDYITKPFDARELIARVKNLIEQRRHLRQKFSAGTVLKPGEVAVTSLDDDLLKRVMTAVEKNIGDEDFDVDDLAEEAYLSRPHLNRKLQALTNLSPAEFIRYIRLQRARELLEKNAGNVTDIAYRVGFSSPSYFSSCFHERFGYPPSEVRHRRSP